MKNKLGGGNLFRSKFQASIAALAAIMCLKLIAYGQGPCGNCGHPDPLYNDGTEGNYQYWLCAELGCANCYEEELPPGDIVGSCDFTCVDANICTGTTYTGPTTTYPGTCIAGCSCQMGSTTIQDHCYQVSIAVAEGSCILD